MSKIELCEFETIINENIEDLKVVEIIKKYNLVLKKKNTSEPYLQSIENGIEISCKTKKKQTLVKTVFINPQYYKATLYAELTFNSTMDDVRRVFGSPTKSCLGWWDRFDKDNVCFHFQYRSLGIINMMTLMSPDVAP